MIGSLNNWLQCDPILEHNAIGGIEDKKQVAMELRARLRSCENTIEMLVRKFTYSRGFIPLVYHRVDHEQMRHNSAFSNETGRVNFSDAWFDIGWGFKLLLLILPRFQRRLGPGFWMVTLKDRSYELRTLSTQ